MRADNGWLVEESRKQLLLPVSLRYPSCNDIFELYAICKAPSMLLLVYHQGDLKQAYLFMNSIRPFGSKVVIL
jgi:hypothetical protein